MKRNDDGGGKEGKEGGETEVGELRWIKGNGNRVSFQTHPCFLWRGSRDVRSER